jgi:hypothetical protein
MAEERNQSQCPCALGMGSVERPTTESPALLTGTLALGATLPTGRPDAPGRLRGSWGGHQKELLTLTLKPKVSKCPMLKAALNEFTGRECVRPGSPGAWTHRSGDLVPLQPKQICHSRTGFQRSQSGIVSDKPGLCQDKGGSQNSLCLGSFTPRKSQGTSFVRLGETKAIHFGFAPALTTFFASSQCREALRPAFHSPAYPEPAEGQGLF